MNGTQKAVKLVLERITKMVEADEGDAEMFAGALEDMLTEVHENDGFGTEGQCDPRGDFRNGAWDMWNVEQD